MALPHKRQNLARFIPFYDFTARTFADAVNQSLAPSERVSMADVQNYTRGRRYPSAREIRAIELAFGGSLPIHVLLEDSMLVNYDRNLRLEVER